MSSPEVIVGGLVCVPVECDFLKWVQHAHVSVYLDGESDAWCMRFSMSAILSTLRIHSGIEGGDVLLQCTGMHRFAALIRWRVSDFLYTRWGIEV